MTARKATSRPNPHRPQTRQQAPPRIATDRFSHSKRTPDSPSFAHVYEAARYDKHLCICAAPQARKKTSVSSRILSVQKQSALAAREGHTPVRRRDHELLPAPIENGGPLGLSFLETEVPWLSGFRPQVWLGFSRAVDKLVRARSIRPGQGQVPRQLRKFAAPTTPALSRLKVD